MRTIAIAAAALLALSACSSSQTAEEKPSESAAGSSADAGAFPTTVTTCGTDITLEKAPERVMFMNATGVEAMHQLGVLDKTVVRSGNMDLSVFDKEVADHVESIESLEGEKMDTGGSVISTEAILEQRVDLVIGYVAGVDQEALAKAGVPVYTPDAFCPEYSIDKADFDLVYKEVDTMAQLFGVQDRAKEVNEMLKKEVPTPAAGAENGTAAVVYVTPGVQKLWTYGPSSMVQPILEANGLKNVYDDQKERVPEMSVEDVLQRDPETVILLHGEGPPADAEKTFRGFKGVEELQAMKNDRFIVMPFVLTDPPSPLSIKGAEELKERLEKLGSN